MGNNMIDFSLYELNGEREYTLTYEYYPENIELLSYINFDRLLESKPRLLEFLYKKARASEEYQKDDFLVFIDRFCSDEKFQLSRIKFPVAHTQEDVTDLVREKIDNDIEIGEDIYYDNYDNRYYRLIPEDESRWKVLTRSFLTPEVDKENNVESKWVRDSPDQIRFILGWIESEICTSVTFQKIGGEWFLTKYYDAG